MNHNTISDKLAYVSVNEDIAPRPLWQASTYVTGNSRILSYQGIDSGINSISHQYDFDNQIMKSICYSADIQSHCNSACWFELFTDSGEVLDMRNMKYPHQTGYHGNVYPETHIKTPDFDITISSIAPIAYTENVPVFHRVKSYVIYKIRFTNTTQQERTTGVRLKLGGKLFAVNGGSDEWWEKNCTYSYCQEKSYLQCRNADLPTLRVLFDNDSTYYGGEAPYLEKRASIAPSESYTMTVMLSFGEESEQLSLEGADHLFEGTLDFWNQIIGSYAFYQKETINDFLFRAALESFLCVRTNYSGEVIGVADSFAPITERTDCSGILLSTMPLLELCPSLYTTIIQWAIQAISSPEWIDFGDLTTSVSPVVMVGLLYRKHGAAALDNISDNIIFQLDRLLTEKVLSQKADCGLYATERLFGYTPVTKYEFGMNVKCYSAFLHWQYICAHRKMPIQSGKWAVCAANLFDAIQHEFLSSVFSEDNIQYAGYKFVADYRLNALHYYEFDGLDIAVVPILGFCSRDSKVWRNTISHMFSPLYQLVQTRDETPLWWERSNTREYLQKKTDPSIIAKLFSNDSSKDNEETLADLIDSIDSCGSIWQMGKNLKVLRSARLSAMAYVAITQNCFGICSNGLERKAVVNNRPFCRIKRHIHGTFSANQLNILSNIGITKQALEITNDSSEKWEVSAIFHYCSTLEVDWILVDGKPCSSYSVRDISSSEKAVWVNLEIDGGNTCAVSIKFKRTRHEWSSKMTDKLEFEDII